QDLYVVSWNPKQTVLLNFQPTNPLHIGDNGFSSPSQVSVVQGDFSPYFFATPIERTTLEQSHLVVRQAAVTTPVSLSKLLSDPAAQAALSTMLDSPPAAAHAHVRTLTDADGGRSTIGAPAAGVFTDESASAATTSSHVVLDLSSVAPVHPDTATAHASGAVPTGGFGAEPTIAAISNSPSGKDHTEETVAGAVIAALARLSEPFAQTVFDLRDGFTTYGDLASARFTDHLRTDRQPPLLVNARAARQADNREILVVMV
ncbi:MAG: hypothetical protein ABIZ49_06920, partial [Opitutaceae bacterium]